MTRALSAHKSISKKGVIMKSIIEKAIASVSEKTAARAFPHINHAGSVYAQITSATKNKGYFTYRLKLLDAEKSIDSRFGEIPNVKSKQELTTGAVVAVALLYGQAEPYIIGEVIP